MKNKIKVLIDWVLKLFPYTRRLLLYEEGFMYPGHYYSPIPDLKLVVEKKETLFTKKSKGLLGIDLREDEQKILLTEIGAYYNDVPFPEQKSVDFRFYFDNTMFTNSDAIFLYSIIRNFKPKNIIEIGSGFSSAVILDTNEKYFQNDIHCTFIEPHQERLHSLLKKSDFESKNVELIEKFAQDIEIERLKQLGENDILFIDSSHVAKVGSDVCYLIFEVLPKLNEGVIIHIHDVFTNFEYPEEWVMEGRAWNEIYLLRAFLQYNESFEVLLFNSFLEDNNEEWFENNMPKCLELHEKRVINGKEVYYKNRGQSIWLKKVK